MKCQVLVNSVCVNRNYFKDVAKWGGIALCYFLVTKVFRKSA